MLPLEEHYVLRRELLWFLGIGVTILALAAAGLAAKPEAPPIHVVNLMTGAFLANHVSMPWEANSAIDLYEYLFALGVGFLAGIGVWLRRRKKGQRQHLSD